MEQVANEIVGCKSDMVRSNSMYTNQLTMRTYTAIQKVGKAKVLTDLDLQQSSDNHL